MVVSGSRPYLQVKWMPAGFFSSHAKEKIDFSSVGFLRSPRQPRRYDLVCSRLLRRQHGAEFRYHFHQSGLVVRPRLVEHELEA